MKKIGIVFVLLLLAKWWFTDPSISVTGNDVTFSYIVKYTQAGKSGEALPMLVALHGNGDTTQNFYETALDKMSVPVRMILVQGPIRKGTGHAWPWSAEDFRQYGESVHEAIDLLAVKYPTVQKPVLLGFSGGAMMAYYQAVKYGDSYSSIFPVSGMLTEELLGDGLTNPGASVYAYHGKGDDVVSFGGGSDAAKLLRERGVNVSLTEFEGGHLGIFTNMKNNITNAIEEKLSGLK